MKFDFYFTGGGAWIMHPVRLLKSLFYLLKPFTIFDDEDEQMGEHEDEHI